jgi:hypothetical protein
MQDTKEYLSDWEWNYMFTTVFAVIISVHWLDWDIHTWFQTSSTSCHRRRQRTPSWETRVPEGISAWTGMEIAVWWQDWSTGLRAEFVTFLHYIAFHTRKSSHKCHRRFHTPGTWKCPRSVHSTDAYWVLMSTKIQQNLNWQIKLLYSFTEIFTQFFFFWLPGILLNRNQLYKWHAFKTIMAYIPTVL